MQEEINLSLISFSSRRFFFRQAGHLQYLSITIRVICLFSSYRSFDHHVERLMCQMWIQMATRRIV